MYDSGSTEQLEWEEKLITYCYTEVALWLSDIVPGAVLWAGESVNGFCLSPRKHPSEQSDSSTNWYEQIARRAVQSPLQFSGRRHYTCRTSYSTNIYMICVCLMGRLLNVVRQWLVRIRICTYLRHSEGNTLMLRKLWKAPWLSYLVSHEHNRYSHNVRNQSAKNVTRAIPTLRRQERFHRRKLLACLKLIAIKIACGITAVFNPHLLLRIPILIKLQLGIFWHGYV